MNIPIQLAKISQGRDHVTTREFAKAINKKPQTIRKNYCLFKHSYGIKPVKIGNQLMWHVPDIAALLNGHE